MDVLSTIKKYHYGCQMIMAFPFIKYGMNFKIHINEGWIIPMENQKIQKDVNVSSQDYLTFHLINVEPKMQELVAAETKKARAKLQREIVAIIKNAGYHREATQMKAMFNL